MTNDQKEVLKLANECGASKLHSDSVIITECYAMTGDELLAFAAALEEKHRAKIAMLVDELKLLELQDFDSEDAPDCPEEAADICNWLIGQFRSHVESIRRDAQQDTDAFIAEVRAKALEDAADWIMRDEDAGTSPYDLASGLRFKAAELRASAAQPEGKETGK